MVNLRNLFKIDAKILSVSATAFGTSLLSGLFSFYYVKVFLEIYKINQHWLNAAQIFYIVCNTISEPLLGYLQDYGCKPCRSRRRVILVGGPFFALAFIYPWFAWYDPDTAPPYMAGIHLVTVMFLWNFNFTLIGSALCGLFAEMSTNHQTRVRLLRYNECAYLLSSCAVFPMDKLSESLRNFSTFRYASIGIGCLGCAAFLITGLNAPDKIAQQTSEPPTDIQHDPSSSDHVDDPINDEGSQITTADEHSLIKAFIVTKQCFKSLDFWCAVGGNFMGWLRIQVFANFLAIFTEGLISSTILPTGSYAIATFYVVCQITPRLVIIVTTPLAAKFGPFRMLMASYILTWLNCAVGLLSASLISYNAMMITLFIDSILTRFQVMFMVIFSDFIDEDTKKHRRKLPASTLIFTLNGLLVKPTVALAPIVVVALLNISNYDQYKNDIRNAPAHLKYVMFLVSCCMPALLALLGFFCMMPYSLKDKHLRNPEETEEQLIEE